MNIGKDVDIGAVLRRIADRRIEEAMKAGKFDNLAGKGKPLDLDPLPADENARAMYWAVKLCRQNNVLQDAMRDEARRRTREPT
jgi:hypothetical protein